MQLIVLDFETYYTKEFGFSRLTTEEYIRDPRFEVIGVAVQVEDGEPEWFSGDRESLRKWLWKFDWKNSMVLAHNTLFDGAILSWIFNIKPMGWFDTLSMARALHGVDAGGSLAKLAQRYEVGVKGEEVVNAINKRRTDFAPEDLERYGEYCRNDVRLCYDLFMIMVNGFPNDELRLIDMTLRMFTHPLLCLDEATLNERLDDLAKERSELLGSLMDKLKCDTEEEVREKLSSNHKFADVLKSFDIPVPMKFSEKQKKDVPALAKKDEGFIALTEHDDPFIQQLCAVRLGTKSTLEEKRIERFIGMLIEHYAGKFPLWLAPAQIIVAPITSAAAAYGEEVTMALLWQILLYAGALFIACFALHGELVRLRPAAKHLTAFYLMVSVGGALGALLTGIFNSQSRSIPRFSYRALSASLLRWRVSRGASGPFCAQITRLA